MHFNDRESLRAGMEARIHIQRNDKGVSNSSPLHVLHPHIKHVTRTRIVTIADCDHHLVVDRCLRTQQASAAILRHELPVMQSTKDSLPIVLQQIPSLSDRAPLMNDETKQLGCA